MTEPARPVRVLLVDDDEDFAVLVKDYLSEITDVDHEIDWVSEYTLAIEALAANQHSACLLDYRLGAQTGLDALQEARRLGSTVPVILLTGQGDREVDLAAMRAGASDYLNKGALSGAGIERAIRYAVDRQRSERALFQASKLAAIGELASMFAHEVNNPVGVIVGKLDLLLNDPRWEFADKVRADLTKVLDHAHRIGTLTRRLLNFSRPTKGERNRTDLAVPLDKALDMLGHRLRSRRVEIAVDLEEDLPPVRADAHELQQVFLNLLINAADAVPDGGQIKVRAYSSRLGEAPAVAVDVEDTGGGIPVEVRENIFKPFFTTKREGEGTGLGLAISRQIVEAHEGTLGFSTKLGEGTLFTVRLPQGT